LNDPTSNEALAEKYDAIAYGAQANAFSHPSHLASMATLFGLRPADVATSRVLEVGCSDGSNLLPMAATFPDAHFVGCDLSARAIAAATSAATELGLSNVTLLQEDFAAIPPALGRFDYIVAHGIYSWVPPAARDALFNLAAERLSTHGVMFVSYNVYPGCHVRQAAWEALHFHVDGIADLRARLDAARSLAALLAEPGLTHEKSDVLFRDEFRRVSQQSDSALFHDDLAQPNDPVYFHQFAAHAARHGLSFLAEAKLLMMSSAGLSPRVQQFVAGAERLAREQYLDFVRVRRFRQSLVCRADAVAESRLVATNVASMHASASTTLVRAAAEGKAFAGTLPASAPGTVSEPEILRAFLHWLLERSPRSVTMTETRAWAEEFRGDRATPSGFAIESMLLDACVVGTVDLHVAPLALVSAPGPRPQASSSARWQARRGQAVTNLRHETMTLQDPAALKLLALLDGTSDREHLAAAMTPLLGPSTRESMPRVEEYLQEFARYALLMA